MAAASPCFTSSPFAGPGAVGIGLGSGEAASACWTGTPHDAEAVKIAAPATSAVITRRRPRVSGLVNNVLTSLEPARWAGFPPEPVRKPGEKNRPTAARSN
jgi:hypothetical protein